MDNDLIPLAPVAGNPFAPTPKQGQTVQPVDVASSVYGNPASAQTAAQRMGEFTGVSEVARGLSGETPWPEVAAAVVPMAMGGPEMKGAEEVLANSKVRAAAQKVEGMFPQYAEKYPEVGPPVLMSKPGKSKPIGKPGGGDWTYDDVTPEGETLHPLAKQLIDSGQAYWSKELTPQAVEFQKARAKIQKDMDVNGYQPYFDPAQRQDINPADYPTTFNSIAQANPARADTLAKWQAAYDTPEARQRLREAYEAGQKIPDADRWYYMKQLQDEYKKEYGDTQGTQEFKRGFSQPMAATTGGATPTANYLMAHYASYLQNKGDPQLASHQLPFPIGGRYAGSNMEQYQNTVRNPDWQGFGLGNEKRHDFDASFGGHRNMPVIDEQMSDMIVPGMQQPDWYGPAADVVSSVAKEYGVDPRLFQEVAWAGHKKMTTEAAGKTFEYEGPMINHINASVERTHRLTGMPRDEIVRRGVVRREIPMYGFGALGAAGAASQQGDDK